MAMKTYSELILIPSFEERLEYLKTKSTIGAQSFGWRRYLNQVFYNSDEWRSFRRDIILRDSGRDLGCEGYDIFGSVTIHHINPITYDDIVNRSPCILDPNNVICCSSDTHKAIHYSNDNAIAHQFAERSPNDTCPWKR